MENHSEITKAALVAFDRACLEAKGDGAHNCMTMTNGILYIMRESLIAACEAMGQSVDKSR